MALARDTLERCLYGQENAGLAITAGGSGTWEQIRVHTRAPLCIWKVRTNPNRLWYGIDAGFEYDSAGLSRSSTPGVPTCLQTLNFSNFWLAAFNIPPSPMPTPGVTFIGCPGIGIAARWQVVVCEVVYVLSLIISEACSRSSFKDVSDPSA